MAVLGGTQVTTSTAKGSGGGGSTSPGGTPTQIQFNNTTFGGVKGSAVNATTGEITITATALGTIPLTINGNDAGTPQSQTGPLLVLSGNLSDSAPGQLQILCPALPGSFWNFSINEDDGMVMSVSSDGGATVGTLQLAGDFFSITLATGQQIGIDNTTGIYNLVATAYALNGVSGVTQTAGTPTSIATTGGLVTTLVVTSDARLKDTTPYVGGLKEILAISPVRYRWNKRGQEVTGDLNAREYVGFVAQNVQAVVPEAIVGQQVAKDGEVYLGFDDRPVIAALVNAVKELHAEIEVLRNLL